MSGESATPDPVEFARARIDAVNRRDMDALMAPVASDAVYDTAPSGMGTYQGHDAIRTFLAGYWECFEELRFELEDATDLGNGVMFLVNRQIARPVGSDAQIEIREAHVIEWAAGVVARITVYNDIEQGRSAGHRLAGKRVSDVA